jgi:hypothetical protein
VSDNRHGFVAKRARTIAAAWSLIVLGGGIVAVATGPANADHLTATTYTFTPVPATPNAVADTTAHLDAGDKLPTQIVYHYPEGHLFAHNNKVAGVPASPVTPVPNDGDVVAKITAIADYNLDGCGADDTLNGPVDSANLLAIFAGGTKFEGGTPPAGTVAQWKIAASTITLYVNIIKVTTDTFITKPHYDLNVTIPISLVACVGTTLTIDQVNYGYSRTITDPGNSTAVPSIPPTLSGPTDRIVQKNPGAGTFKQCLRYVGSDPEGNVAPHQSCLNYSIGGASQGTGSTTTTAATGGSTSTTAAGSTTSAQTSTSTAAGATGTGTGASTGTSTGTATGSQVAGVSATRSSTGTSSSAATGTAAAAVGADGKPLASTGSNSLNLFALALLSIAAGMQLMHFSRPVALARRR